MDSVYLASSSSWRAQILRDAGLSIHTFPAAIDEYSLLGSNPVETAILRAKAKGEAVRKSLPKDALIIAADQVVSLQGEIFDKPKNDEERFSRLCLFRGKGHDLTTAVSIFYREQRFDLQEHSKVFFRKDLTDVELKAYIHDGEARNCAGGYMVEQKGSWLIEKVEGDWLNVVGLPLFAILDQLRPLGGHRGPVAQGDGALGNGRFPARAISAPGTGRPSRMRARAF